MFCIVAGIVRLEPARQPVFLDRNFLTQGPGQTAIKQNKGKRKGRERERESVCVGRFQWKVKIFRISIITVRKSRVIVKLTRAGILFNL